MKKFGFISIVLILVSIFGYTIALQSSQAAMAGMGEGHSACLLHCLGQAAPFSQQNIIISLAVMSFVAALLGIALTFLIIVRPILVVRFLHILHPYYLFKTVVLRN